MNPRKDVAWLNDENLSGTRPAAPATSSATWHKLGVTTPIAQALASRNFKQPTPIQRTSLIHSLAAPPRDILGMARTGSGKTLAYMIPLLQRLNCRPLVSLGPRALVLCPNRELALQIIRVGKELDRGISVKKDSEKSKLQWALIIGGEDMEKQFAAVAQKPDILVATPGRLLHVMIEMSMDLRLVEVVVYDEADRLFEMGFDTQLREILHRLPVARQNLMFSASLPTGVADFAKAGLTNPLLIRLDSETKLSPDLAMAFFSIRPYEKSAVLLVLLEKAFEIRRTSPQIVVFVSTKHHVEYILLLLRAAGYTANHVYGSLDQVARKQQLEGFRKGVANILVVTDVAARGLDMPDVDLVINYDFPPAPRTFLHRVGRTARAGRQGTAWSLITVDDIPFALDLQRFLSQTILDDSGTMLGQIQDHLVGGKVEYIKESLEQSHPSLPILEQVMRRGQKMFMRTRNRASERSYRETKILLRTEVMSSTPLHPLFADTTHEFEKARQSLTDKLSDFTPTPTGGPSFRRPLKVRSRPVESRVGQVSRQLGQAGSSGIRGNSHFRDTNFFLQDERIGAEAELEYSLAGTETRQKKPHGGASLASDEYRGTNVQRASQLKGNRKLVSAGPNSVAGAKSATVRSESGVLVPASYKSGRYEAWRRNQAKSSATGQVTEPHLQPQASHGRLRRSGAATSLKTPEDVQRDRAFSAKRKAKNQRPTSKGSRRR